MRNVKRLVAYEAVFKKFTETSHPVSGKPIFATMRDFMCFLAVLGFHEGSRTCLTGPTIELDGRVFENHEASRDVVYLIALAGARDANILQPEQEEEMLRAFEEYAATGTKVLEQWLRDCPDDHIGDQAILTALRRDGFFGGQVTSLQRAIEQVDF